MQIAVQFWQVLPDTAHGSILLYSSALVATIHHVQWLQQEHWLYLAQVATRRTRTAGKVEIPNVDDHVSKLEHMGKETVKKLQDIKGAAVQAGVDINIPENCINKGRLYIRACITEQQPGADLHCLLAEL